MNGLSFLLPDQNGQHSVTEPFLIRLEHPKKHSTDTIDGVHLNGATRFKLASLVLLPSKYVGDSERHRSSRESIHQLMASWSDLTITSTIYLFSLDTNHGQDPSLIFQGKVDCSSTVKSEDSFIVADDLTEDDRKDEDLLLYTQASTIPAKTAALETGSITNLEWLDLEVERLNASQDGSKASEFLEDAFQETIGNFTDIDPGVHILYVSHLITHLLHLLHL